MSNSNLESLRHSFAHLLAAAVLKLHPDAKLGTGPATDNGFFYDFLFSSPFSDADLKAVSKEMKKTLNKESKFTSQKISPQEAKELFQDQPFKLELISDLEAQGEKKIGLVTGPGDFSDICAGPHVVSTSDLKKAAFQLDKVAGAFWKSDESNQQLTRISAFAFATEKELNDFLTMREEAKKRDHRKLGQELDLFSISEKVGPGLILWHPKLAKAREAAESFWRQFHRQRGYDTIYTPHIGRSELWETSGHLENFRENMYSPMDVDGENYFVKPMNCPFHVEIYKSRPRSWRDFPFRWNELGAVYRYEKSGELHGMSRVRGFTQDDAHILCRKDQLLDEYKAVLEFSLDIFEVFGFNKKDVKGYIAIRDPKDDKYIGDDEIWESAEKVVQQVVKESGIKYEIEEGGAKFYGPALDLKIKDAIGREWQLTTIQLDMNLPSRFHMTYQGPEGEEQPIMIHRALFGSLERFFSILIEHFAGAFPTWLAPVQVAILPVADPHLDFAKDLYNQLLALDFRPELFDPADSLGKRIRLSETQKIPFILVLGDKETKSNEVTIRRRGSDKQETMTVKKFLSLLQKESDSKK